MTAKEANEQFPIGTWIKFERLYHRSGDRKNYNHSSRRTTTAEPQAGIVVGARWKCAGKVERGNDGYYFETVGGKVLVLLVRAGYANKPFEVIPRHATTIAAQLLPANRVDPGMAQSYREHYALRPQEWPRDPTTGRFTANK
jgi:hypothetical protein